VYTSTLRLAFEIQDREEEYKAQIKDKEEAMVGDPVLTKLDAKTVEKEAELEELRKAAWEKRNGILKDFQSSSGEGNTRESARGI
jgi:hypothetical protein